MANEMLHIQQRSVALHKASLSGMWLISVDPVTGYTGILLIDVIT